MARIWEPQPIQVYQKWIEDILTEASDNLNDWETTFVASIQMRLDTGRNLTQNQAEKLETIYAEKTK